MIGRLIRNPVLGLTAVGGIGALATQGLAWRKFDDKVGWFVVILEPNCALILRDETEM